MKSAAQFRVVLVTAPDLKVARQLARRALSSRLAACASLVPRIESHYWWKDILEKSAETLIIFKTRARLLDNLEKLILAHHPYETPEFVALNISGGNGRYLDWLARETEFGSPRPVKTRGQ